MSRNIHDEALHGFERDQETLSHGVGTRNMVYGLVHGAFFHMATAFADPYAIVPLFLAGFTNSVMFIGLMVSLVETVGVLPQLPIARVLQLRPAAAKPLMLTGIWMRCAAWGLIALMVLSISEPGHGVLVLFALLISIYSLGGGIAVLPFRQVISQTIRLEQRSSFFGGRLLLGGLLSVLAAYIISMVLGGTQQPCSQNYGLLFLFSFLSLIVAYTGMSRLRFPSQQTVIPNPSVSFRKGVHQVWHDYPVLKRLVAVRLLSGGGGLVFPFLILYATQDLGISLGWVGFFVMAQRGGAIVSNLAWMPLGNRRGTRLIILLGLILSLSGIGVMFTLHSPGALIVAFLLAGAGMSALTVGFNGYILEIGIPAVRPILFALEGTLMMPLYFMPLLGGWLIDGFGYRPVLLIGALMLLTSLGLAFNLCEPRRHDPACGPCAMI